jgi:hypothetical protein
MNGETQILGQKVEVQQKHNQRKSLNSLKLGGVNLISFVYCGPFRLSDTSNIFFLQPITWL